MRFLENEKWPPLLRLCHSTAMTRLVTLITCLAAMLWATEEIRTKRPRSHETERLASIESLDWLVGNFQHIVADYYWLRSVEHFGRADAHRDQYPLLGPLLERSLRLDPHFFKPAYVAGTILNTSQEKLALSQTLLKTGMEHHPSRWELPFIAGFNAYMFQNAPDVALPLLQKSATLPNCPPRVQKIATKLSVETAQPEIGLALTESMMETVTDPELLQSYEERRRQLILEIELKALRRGLDYFKSEFGRAPTTVIELLKAMGNPNPSAADPLDGEYFIAQDGSIQTTSDSKRLKFSKEAKDQRR